MARLYYSGFPDYSWYRRRIDHLSERRHEALIFVIAAVGLSMGISLLAGVISKFLPENYLIPVALVGLAILVILSYFAMWIGSDQRHTIPLSIVEERSGRRKGKLIRCFALAPSVGRGISEEAGRQLIERSGEICTDREIEQVELRIAETVLFGVLCYGFRDGWHFPGNEEEDLNVKWIPETNPISGSTCIQVDSKLIGGEHPFLPASNAHDFFLVPKGTQFKFVREEKSRCAELRLTNRFVELSVFIKFQGKGIPDRVIASPWVPKGNTQLQVIYLITMQVEYSIWAKLPWSKKALEHMNWVERVIDYLESEISFREFERRYEIEWRRWEVEAIEKLLGRSRWEL